MAYFAYMRISTEEERAKQKIQKAGKVICTRFPRQH